MNKKVLTLLMVVMALSSSAQELNLPTRTQYLADNPFVISPVYAGIGDHVKVRMNGLTQWVGIKDAPDTQSIAADVRLGEKSGVGVLFYNDRNGATHQYGARASFAHHLTLDKYEDHFLSFGISYNYNQFLIDSSEFTDDVIVPGTPPSQNLGDIKTANHNFDVGVLWRLKGFYISLNASNILGKDLDVFAINEPTTLRNYYMYTGYRWKRTRTSSFEIEPSAFFQWFESDNRGSLDVNLKFRMYDFEDYYWAGITYRSLTDQIADPLYVGPMFGLKKSNLYFAYSYQIILNEVSGFNSGTHMITLGIDLFQGISNCRCTH